MVAAGGGGVGAEAVAEEDAEGAGTAARVQGEGHQVPGWRRGGVGVDELEEVLALDLFAVLVEGIGDADDEDAVEEAGLGGNLYLSAGGGRSLRECCFTGLRAITLST